MISRKAINQDIPRICNLEKTPEFRNFVGFSSEEEHLKLLDDPDAAYWILEDESENIVGFALLRGLCSEHLSLELKRIVVGVPNQGFGKKFLNEIVSKAFDEYGAHRIWLDVFETNTRARHVYRTLGFSEDGIFREAVYRDGNYHSLILMSLLDREYQHRRESHS
jgi:diamine N-acetyltransferase